MGRWTCMKPLLDFLRYVQTRKHQTFSQHRHSSRSFDAGAYGADGEIVVCGCLCLRVS